MIDLSRLAEPLSEASPCGIDCEYEGDFLALTQAVVGKPEQQFGDTVIPAVEPEWRSVERMATELLSRTKDIRVVLWLTLASTHLHGVAGFSAGLALVQSLCERYWDDVHPRMVIDGDEDPYLRINAISAFSDGGGGYSDGSGIMRAFRASNLVSQPLQVTVRDVELSVAKDASARYSEAQILMALTDAAKSGAGGIEAFKQAREAVTSLNLLVGERFGSGELPDLSALMALFKSVSMVVERIGQGSKAADNENSSDSEAENTGVGEASASLVASGAIRSRADVNRALERVCEYLERFEPSNPAVLFARRAQNMLDRNFLDIMQELSPDSVQQLQLITGGKLPEE
ncbi:MAG: type VI secretion system protein TssA [Rhodoferax sp.]|uniref:type VI secretion system protein TssA n=1 Tax=Rhodoferax sp. TaxID=50421 RepID=UPI001B48E5D3|nr:type VI secretion system protein TssA [Rhodoferax sp.]MBP9147841.1 type VI secretion system protein TssA [Rhodoferax sp.]MBP9736427.1 type VI secretion system protein TssA [Rhodoferax sp.]